MLNQCRRRAMSTLQFVILGARLTVFEGLERLKVDIELDGIGEASMWLVHNHVDHIYLRHFVFTLF